MIGLTRSLTKARTESRASFSSSESNRSSFRKSTSAELMIASFQCRVSTASGSERGFRNRFFYENTLATARGTDSTLPGNFKQRPIPGLHIAQQAARPFVFFAPLQKILGDEIGRAGVAV